MDVWDLGLRGEWEGAFMVIKSVWLFPFLAPAFPFFSFFFFSFFPRAHGM